MAWVRGPLARLVRGVGGYYLGSRTTGPPGAGGGGYGLGSRATGPPSVGGRTIVTPQAPPLAGGDRGYGLGTRAAGPPGAERLLTARRIIGLLKYPLELGKIRRGQG